MVGRLLSRFSLVALSLVALHQEAGLSQGSPTGRLAGMVTDEQNRIVAGARIAARNSASGAEYSTSTNELGTWVVPSVRAGTYDVTASAPGFRSTCVRGVKLDAGADATVPLTLRVGGADKTVVVQATTDVPQAESATVSSTITVRQHSELPLASRDGLQLVLLQAGIQTPGSPRTSSFQGLTKTAIAITVDGANVQDNYQKSTDGFFGLLQPRLDSIEEVTVSSAATGADLAAGGSVQIRFVTKSGSNDFHGGLFYQHRNDALNANYYFNNIDGLPRDTMRLHQFGGSVGGPLTIPGLFRGRDRAFFFVNYEEFRLPQTYSLSRTVLTDAARQADYVYKDNQGNVRTVNLYKIAAAKGFPSTPDPAVSEGLDLIASASKKGILQDRIATNNDYTRLNMYFQDPGSNTRRYVTGRFDFRLSPKHDLELVHNYQYVRIAPDSVNGFFSLYPDLGTLVGSPEVMGGSQRRDTFSFVAAERWTISPRMINEFRATSSGNGTLVFLPEFTSHSYALFGGYYVSNPYTSPFFAYRNTERRNTPVLSIEDNLHWLKGTHDFHFGGGFTQLKSFFQDFDTGAVPALYLGLASGDPVNTGSTNIFTTANFPGSTPGQRSSAGALYAFLTGRISYTERKAVLDEQSRRYAYAPYSQRNHLREFGLFAQDSWKPRAGLTLNYGLRWQLSFPPVNENGVYSRPGADGVWGLSGSGNLFKPGVFEGELSQMRPLEPGERMTEVHYRDFAPSFGFAWSPSERSGRLGAILGKGGSAVIRGGYSIAYVREGFDPIIQVLGRNQGPTVNTGTTPAQNPTVFGQPGSRLLRDGSYPFLPMPEARFPIVPAPGAEINEYRPVLRPGYVQSWSFGIQKEIWRQFLVDVRYVGNHGTRMWRRIGIGEINIFENGFLNEFRIAQENLRIARSVVPASNNFGNQGLPGQSDIPLMSTALGFTSDLNTATSLVRGEAGRVAYQIATDLTRMNRLIKSGLVPSVTRPDPSDPSKALTYSNFFVVNPQSPVNATIMDNATDSNYHSLQVEVTRRMRGGLQFQGNYSFARSLASIFGTQTTLRDNGIDKAPAARDIRHGAGVSWIHELPFGAERRFLNGRNVWLAKLLEGWQWSGTLRIHSGPPMLLTSDRKIFNYSDGGFVLHNITHKELQKLIKIRKETVCTGSVCKGVVYWLPQDLIDNTLAAFELGGKTLADLKQDRPYIGPPTTAGVLGHKLYLYGPWTSRWDLSLMKKTRLAEGVNFELRVDFLNAFNQSAIMIQSPTADVGSAGMGATFGQTLSSYRDYAFSGTNDPGGRIIEFQLRLRF